MDEHFSVSFSKWTANGGSPSWMRPVFEREPLMHCVCWPLASAGTKEAGWEEPTRQVELIQLSLNQTSPDAHAVRNRPEETASTRQVVGKIVVESRAYIGICMQHGLGLYSYSAKVQGMAQPLPIFCIWLPQRGELRTQFPLDYETH